MLRPPLSVNVYISFSTMSVVSPTPRENNSVCSNIGRCISLKPKSLIVFEAVLIMYDHFHDSEGKISLVPLGAIIAAIIRLSLSVKNLTLFYQKKAYKAVIEGRLTELLPCNRRKLQFQLLWLWEVQCDNI